MFMKRIIVIFGGLLLIAVFTAILCVPLYANYRQDKLADTAVASWIEDNLSSSQYLTYSIMFEENALTDTYKVALNKENSGRLIALIEYKHETEEKNTSPIVYYLSIEGDTISLYAPNENNGYIVLTLKDSALCSSVKRLLTFSDVGSLFKGGVLNAGYSADKSIWKRISTHDQTDRNNFGYDYYEICRSINAGELLRVTALLSGQEPVDPSLNVTATMRLADPKEMYVTRRFSIDLSGMDGFRSAIYKAITRSDYENIYKGDAQRWTKMKIVFNNLFDNPTEISLPQVN